MDNVSVAERVLSYIEEHLGEELSLEGIAEELHYSKYYVARTFREKMGITVHKYIQGRRLSEAARKLVQTRQPILDIAFDAGYGSQQAFTQAFHQEYRCAPQQYRRVGQYIPRQERIRLQTKYVLALGLFRKGGLAA